MISYENMVPAVFLRRLNRFTAEVELEGRVTLCHVKNTGRCRELLLPGARVWCQRVDSEKRKTAYSLITVEKDGHFVNLDSQVPNAVAAQWMAGGGAGFTVTELRREVCYGASRLDLAFRRGQTPCLMEVKGVTLNRDGVAVFPDAPTERGTRHIQELVRAAEEGWGAYLLFVAAMDTVDAVRPNWKTDPQFARALIQAQQAGVQLLGVRCRVTENSISAADRIPVYLDAPGESPK